MSDFTDADRALLHELRDGQKELYHLLTQKPAAADPAFAYVNGLRDPRPDGSAIPQLGDHYRAIDPEFKAFQRVIARDFLTAFPEVVLPIENGVDLVTYNASNAGFGAAAVAHNFDGTPIPDAVPWFGGRFDRIDEHGNLTPGWEPAITKAWNLWLDSHPNLLGDDGFGQTHGG